MIGKRGISQSALIGLIIVVVFLAIALGIIVILKGKGISILDYLKQLIRGFGGGS